MTAPVGVSEKGGESFLFLSDDGRVVDSERQRRCLLYTSKSGLIVRRKGGSRFFIATLLTTLELEPDAPVSNGCGSRCV